MAVGHAAHPTGMQGQSDWKNISHIVRATFKAFHDVLANHSESLKRLSKVIDDKASREEVSSALQSSTTEVCGRLQKVERQAARLPSRAVKILPPFGDRQLPFTLDEIDVSISCKTLGS